MSISFILTCRNALPFLREALGSLSRSVVPGDEVIIVDDGSDDGSVAVIRDFLAGGDFPATTETKTVFLGVRTFGRRGVAANVGLSEATRPWLMLFEGTDQLDPTGITHTRTRLVGPTPDLLFTTCLERDLVRQITRPAPDAKLWHRIDRRDSTRQRLDHALALPPAPWRMICSRKLLEAASPEGGTRLRFHEGDAQLEDVLFHWQACLAAQDIGFLDVVTCQHGVNLPARMRPGHPSGNDAGPTAAFTHHRRLRALLPETDAAHQAIAAQWLVNSMAEHLARLPLEEGSAYARAGAAALAEIPSASWVAIRNGLCAVSPAQHYALALVDRLRDGDIRGTIDSLERDDLRRRIGRIVTEQAEISALVGATHRMLRSLVAIQRYDSLRRLAQPEIDEEAGEG
jgi:hypothetical protein